MGKTRIRTILLFFKGEHEIMVKKKKEESRKASVQPSEGGSSLDKQHCERVLREGDSILSESDLKELVNTIYSGYHYAQTQSDKLVQLIDFLALESNKFSRSELAGQTQRLSAYLDIFSEFLKRNFRAGEKTEDGDMIYIFNTEETNSETEAFLVEFQMIALDAEKAYRNYRAIVVSSLET
jgi:hypothetical protein